MDRRKLLALSAAGGTVLLGAGGTALLGGAGLAGALPALGAAGAAGTAADRRGADPVEPRVPATPPGPVPDPSKGVTFFSNPTMQFQALFAFGAAAYGAGEFGEVLTAVNQVQAAGAGFQSYYDAFVATGKRVAGLANRELRAGHLASARSAYLRAAQYFDQALYFVLGTATPAAEPNVYAAMQLQWDLATQLMDPPVERVAIPYGRTTLPAYFLRASASDTPKPTVIVNNGSDAQNLDTYAWGGAAAVERGWNAVIFEGPGQGSMLFERKIPFRPDWEKVIAPVVDWLHRRPDVDKKRIALTGWSMGGELVARAAAFEKRLAAVVSDPGFIDVWSAWPATIRSVFATTATRTQVNGTWRQGYVPVIEATATLKFTVAKRGEIFGRPYLEAARAGKVFTDMWSFGHTLMQFDVAGLLHRIDVPYLVTQYQLDTLVPAGDPQKLYGGLASRRKKLDTFTTAQGAEYHCAPMAPQTRNQVVYDWLGSAMGA
ncbi:MAG TPA: alpha/beta fold hydrolase [Acidimicrobiales bacterium]|nr:alpha/beta fold hydrolase [Acidimicrobiales bacterium]